MDKKFFVPFKTAQQIREKGYNGICDYYYAPDKQLYFGVTRVSNDTLDYENNGIVAAPTYHEVINWLDSQGIYINCFAPTRKRDVGRYISSFYNNNTGYWSTCKYNSTTREGALNMAIIAALEML